MIYLGAKKQFKLVLTAFAVFGLVVSNSVVPDNSYALTPAAIPMCTTELASLSSALATPVAITLGGTIGTAFGSMEMGNVLSPLLYAILCEGDSISMTLGQLQNTEQHVATTTLQAMGTATDKSFAERSTYQQQAKEGANNLPAGACDQAYVTSAAGTASSLAAQEALSVNSKLEYYDSSQPLTGTSLSTSLMVTPGTLTPLAIFGGGDLAGGGVIGSTADAQQYILNATNPIPEPPVPNNILLSPAGAKMLAKEDMDHANVELSQKTLTDIMALHTPVVNLTPWQQGILGATGVTTPTVATNMSAATGPSVMSSIMSILAQSVHARFSNPAYLAGIYGTTSSSRQVLQSMASAQVIDLEVEYQTLLAEQNQEALLAEMLARMINAGRF